MSGPELTPEAQLRYLLSWFDEFSELQREDFLPILAAAQGGKHDQLAATLAVLSCQDKPLSLFQCRMKLFNQWYPTWSQEVQDKLVKGVCEADEDFGKKLHELITNGVQMNGELNGEDRPVELDGQAQEQDYEAEGQAIPPENIPLEITASS